MKKMAMLARRDPVTGVLKIAPEGRRVLWKERYGISPEELRIRGEHALKDTTPLVILVLPRVAGGKRIRLSGRSGPFGKVIQTSARGTVAEFAAEEVLRWMDKVGV